jgi:hypothetical protein
LLNSQLQAMQSPTFVENDIFVINGERCLPLIAEDVINFIRLIMWKNKYV